MRIVNKKFVIFIFVVIVVVLVLCILLPYISKSKERARIQNEMQTLRETPAAEYCINSEWTLEVLQSEEGDIYWMCNFKDWSACEISEYFRWECLSETEKWDISYCTDWSICGGEESDDLNSWIEEMNDIVDSDEEVLDSDDLDGMDIDSLYDYYENEFINSGEMDWKFWEFNWWEDVEDQMLASCNWVWWTILWDKCYLSNWIEIAF